MPLESYQIISKIGRGKYCSVYRVQRQSDYKQFALKKVNLNILDERGKKNVLAEAKLLRIIRNENIVNLIQTFYDENNNTLCLVLQLAEEGDLGDLIETCIKDKTKLKEEISNGLLYLHSNNILHRDIKPTNILRFSNQKVKISDFNVSKISDNLTYTRTGTLSYASPEIWKGLPYDTKSDIWSFGCLLYELICLKKAFCNEDMEELYKKITKAQYARIGQSYSKELRDLITFMIQVNPKLRPSSNTIYKMCQNRKSSVKGHIFSRARGNIITPKLKSCLKYQQFDLDQSLLGLSCQEPINSNRQRLYSQISKKYYQPTHRKHSYIEGEDKLQNLQVNKDLGLKRTQRGLRYGEQIQESPQYKRQPRILLHKLNRQLLKRPRRHTQI